MPQSNESPSWFISYTRVHDIFSIIDSILYKFSKGIATLSSFFIASPVVISNVPLWKRIFKTEGGYFKYLDTVHVDFIDSELPDEQFSHITSYNNDSWK